MKKDKLEAEARKVEWAVNLADQNGDIDRSLSYDVRYLIECINKLYEPEVEENFYTFDNAKKWLQENGFVVFEKDKLGEEVQRMVDETYEAMNEKPVIPQFLADYIEKYKDEGLSLGGWLTFNSNDQVIFDWLCLNVNAEEKRRREYLLIDAIRYGYEVEKEKKYLVKLPHESDMGLPLYLSRQFGVEWVDEETMADHITEAEIKAIDERYWAFAEEVTE